MSNLTHTIGLGTVTASISLPSSPSRNLSPAAIVLGQLQATEPVVIQSSVPRGIGPYPRAIRRRNNIYMLPRSPQSPSLQRISGSVPQLPRRKDYLPTNVCKLEVETFKTTSDCWSPTFPTSADNLVKAMDPRQAPTFDPMAERTSSFFKLRSLDLFPALGLAASDFWALFSRCLVCHNLMTTRTTPYHVCQNGNSLGAEVCTDVTVPPAYHFLRLLDAHDIGHESGVSEDVFRSIFHACDHCGRYMTKRMSFHHNEGDAEEESDSDASFSLKLECIYLRMDLEAGACLSARKYQKMHHLDIYKN